MRLRPVPPAALLWLVAAPLAAQEFRIAPYLQAPAPTAVWVLWETSSGDESVVEWGPTTALGQSTSGTATTGYLTSRVHSVRVDGLSPGTRYWYRARTGSAQSAPRSFVTPPARDQAGPFTLAVLSDTQRDALYPGTLDEIVHDGIIALATADGADLDEALALVLIAGDLVSSGLLYSQWRDQFFAPMADLLVQVPVLPVPGNHEFNASSYFTLFHLPVSDGDEHRWFHDHGNLRIIGLDSNTGYRTQAQLDWLQTVLDQSCVDGEVDFVAVQLHHPAVTELWPVGELDYAMDVVERLELFAGSCHKPTLYLFGHTHAYARGQSREVPLLWVNVATAAGNIDHWGEYADQYDADLFSVGQDEWGFVLLDVEPGPDPQLTLRRISRGDESQARANDERDRVLLRRYNTPPATPATLGPLGPGVAREGVRLQASAFADVDGDTHQATQWQLAARCEDFAAPLLDRWRQDRNEYQGVDLQAGDDLADEELPALAAGRTYCWRVRYRDSALGWSAWSAPASFTTAGEDAGPGLDAGADASGGGDAGAGRDHLAVDGALDRDAATVADASRSDHDLADATAALDAGARDGAGLEAGPAPDHDPPADASLARDASAERDDATAPDTGGDASRGDASADDRPAPLEAGATDRPAGDGHLPDGAVDGGGAILDAAAVHVDVAAPVTTDLGAYRGESHVVTGCGCQAGARGSSRTSLLVVALALWPWRRRWKRRGRTRGA